MTRNIKSLPRWITTAVFVALPLLSISQSLRGTWQLVRSMNCIESELISPNDTTASLAAEMKQMSSVSPEIIKFGEKGVGEQSTRILNKKKTNNQKAFLYKMNGETLLILDKKSQTIAETYNVDKLSADSLIISNSSRACEINIFVKIKEPR